MSYQNNAIIINITKINKLYQLLILLILYCDFVIKIKNKESVKPNKSILNSTNICNIQNKKPNIYNYIEKSNLKLYNSSEHSYLSIILHYKDFQINDDKLINLISDLLNQTFIDIQIILIYNSNFTNIKTLFSNVSFLNKSLELYTLDNMDLINKLCDVIEVIKGKYLIILNEFLKLKKQDIYKIYNITKGKIDNIFNYSTTYNSSFYIIRTKIIRNIFDDGINLNNFEELLKYISIYPLTKLNYIPISFCPNNLYTTLTYTSMLSILITKAYYTYIPFYLLIPKDFSKDNILFLESLYQQYDYFNITFITMDDRYKKAFTTGYLTAQTYYRYSLGELIPYLDKIIYIDSDTICFKDLSNFYNLNFRGHLILGRMNKYTKNNKTDRFSINAGILLLNLKMMRKIKFETKFLNIVNNGFYINNIHTKNSDDPGININTADQALLNIYFNKYIGLFPPEYNAKGSDFNSIMNFNNDSMNLYGIEYIYYSFKYPAIRHFGGSKKHITLVEDWKYVAKNSKYFNKLTDNFLNIYNYSFTFL